MGAIPRRIDGFHTADTRMVRHARPPDVSV